MNVSSCDVYAYVSVSSLWLYIYIYIYIYFYVCVFIIDTTMIWFCRDHPIVAVMTGDARLASTVADDMLAQGIYVIGFSYPVSERCLVCEMLWSVMDTTELRFESFILGMMMILTWKMICHVNPIVSWRRMNQLFVMILSG